MACKTSFTAKPLEDGGVDHGAGSALPGLNLFSRNQSPNRRIFPTELQTEGSVSGFQTLKPAENLGGRTWARTKDPLIKSFGVTFLR
jgi:hypothetical protein